MTLAELLAQEGAAEAARAEEEEEEGSVEEGSSDGGDGEEGPLPDGYAKVKRVLEVRGSGKRWEAKVSWEGKGPGGAPWPDDWLKWEWLGAAARSEARALQAAQRRRGPRRRRASAQESRERRGEERAEAAAAAKEAAAAATRGRTLRDARAVARTAEAETRAAAGGSRAGAEAGDDTATSGSENNNNERGKRTRGTQRGGAGDELERPTTRSRRTGAASETVGTTRR